VRHIQESVLAFGIRHRLVYELAHTSFPPSPPPERRLAAFYRMGSRIQLQQRDCLRITRNSFALDVFSLFISQRTAVMKADGAARDKDERDAFFSTGREPGYMARINR
jgi:hypothetical protein